MRPCIALSSKQRMSLACLLGYTFGATKGYTLDIEHNGSHFRTDDHAQATGQFFANAAPRDSAVGREGVAVIAFPTQAGTDVDTAIGDSLVEAPRLSLHSDRAIDSPATLNKAVAEAKGALAAFRASRQLEVIHLFIKAPSHFATALGHRLNGVGRLQLYDWIDDRYVLTTQLC